MSKLALLIFVLFMGVVALFAISNKEATTVIVPFGETYEIPKISLILFSAAVGALAVFSIFLIRDARRFVTAYQFQKKRKKEDRINELYGKAMNAILANDTVEARSSLSGILKDEPGHTDALLRLGDISFKEESLADALGYYRAALDSSPKSIEALFSLSGTKEAMRKWPEALGHVEEILDIDPDNLSALYKKRSLMEREGRWEDLVDVQKSIIKHANTEKDRQREQANLLGYRYEQARDSLEKGAIERANKEFRAILRTDKNFIPACLGVAEVMLREGEALDAASFLEKAYEQSPSQIILARLEDLLINVGEPSRLIRIYQSAVPRAQNPSAQNTLRFFLGKLYYRLEMIDDAFETLRTVDTDAYPELYQLLGELYMRRQQCEKAVEEFKKTIKMKKALRLPYCCSNCGNMSEEWSGRCPSCNDWNTYQFNLYGTCKV